MQRRTPRSFYLVVVVLNVLLFLALEAGTRAYFARHAGSAMLWYGTEAYRQQQQLAVETKRQDFHRMNSRSVSVHRYDVGDYSDYAPDQRGNYSKYLPNQTKTLHSTVTGEMTTARINNHGLRGSDFEREKPDGVVRIMTLGASSTFGYGSRDDETYPRQLERILNESAEPGVRYEVINFGVPHATSDHILSLFLVEGLRLQPDVVTLYAGANDSHVKEEARSGPRRLWNALRERVLVLEFTHHLLGSFIPASTESWSAEYANRRSDAFLRNVAALHEACTARGIRFLPITQQARSRAVSRDELKGLSYEAEARLVRDQVARGRIGDASFSDWRDAKGEVERLPTGRGKKVRTRFTNLEKTRVFLIHTGLMSSLHDWAQSSDVTLVDGIAHLDEYRNYLTSWVHLHPEANRMLARAIADEILP